MLAKTPTISVSKLSRSSSVRVTASLPKRGDAPVDFAGQRQEWGWGLQLYLVAGRRMRALYRMHVPRIVSNSEP